MNVVPFCQNRDVCNIYSFGIYSGTDYTPAQTKAKFKKNLKDAEVKAQEKGYSFATLFVSSKQESILREPIESLGWEQVSSAKNPVHNLHTICYLFVKELTSPEPEKEQSVVSKIAKKLSIGKGRRVAKERSLPALLRGKYFNKFPNCLRYYTGRVQN